MARLLLVSLLLVTVGCASMTERIVSDAMRGLVWEATYTPKDGGNPNSLAALYGHLTKALGIHVQYVHPDDEMLQGAFGISYHAEEGRYIRLRQDLSIIGSIEVLAHEAAHLYQPPYMNRSQGDVFAEIVSARVASRLGVPGAADTSALWLRQHKPNLRVALDLQNEIAHVANLLTPGANVTSLLGHLEQ
jgi:hypothetical protein